MKLISSKYRRIGFTSSDLLIVMVTVALAVLLAGTPYSRSNGRKSTRLKCVSNLKQIGLAFRLWSADHGERFPMSVSPFEGGTSGFSRPDDAFYHYLAISNKMNSPKVLVCPCDKERKQTPDFATFDNRNLSYFIGLDARELDPQMILSGDRNISTKGCVISGIFRLNTNPPINWTKDIHDHCGNIGLSDGHVDQLSDSALMNQINSHANFSARIAIP